jgi:hypothetical protein
MDLVGGAVVAERFRLVRELGAGGMGSVWVAHDERLDIPCAVKFILGEAAQSAQMRSRFEREARSAAQLRSPNVVQILDHGISEGTPYIAMELLEGEDLEHSLKRLGRLDARQTVAIASQVAKALTRAHAAALVHRDLKPANIFLVRDEDHDVAKVLDFGIAKSNAEGLGDSNTQTGTMVGTPFYMSPEQTRANKIVDHRSDLWALAVIVFECVTGKLPFASQSLGDVFFQIVSDPPAGAFAGGARSAAGLRRVVGPGGDARPRPAVSDAEGVRRRARAGPRPRAERRGQRARAPGPVVSRAGSAAPSREHAVAVVPDGCVGTLRGREAGAAVGTGRSARDRGLRGRRRCVDLWDRAPPPAGACGTARQRRARRAFHHRVRDDGGPPDVHRDGERFAGRPHGDGLRSRPGVERRAGAFGQAFRRRRHERAEGDGEAAKPRDDADVRLIVPAHSFPWSLIMPRRPAIVCVILASSLTSTVGLAQQGPPPADTGAKPAPAVDAGGKKEEARARFEKGLALADKAAWDAALAEFFRSIELFPSRAATKNAAVCLRKLNRNDEALDLYEGLLRDFRDLPADLKAEAQRALLELRPLVGTIEIDAAQLGASITVDGRRRGENPLFAPLRVNAGSHVVRLYSEGFEPFEASTEVAGGQTAHVTARLVRLVQAGSLRVTEKSGKALDVVVDGNVVGTTPWKGAIATGDHTVMLRGEERFGTTPAPVSIRAGQQADLALTAEELDAAMRVVPVPADASVAVDGLFVGRGAWEGRVRPGTHKVALVADGYFNADQEVKVDRGGRGVVATTLKRDPRSPRWRKPGRFMIELGGAGALSPSFGGDIARSCTGPCTHGLPLGGYGIFHGGYELGSGFGFGVETGYLAMQQSTFGRSTSLQAVGIKNPDTGTATDVIKLRGFLAGAFAGSASGIGSPSASGSAPAR